MMKFMIASANDLDVFTRAQYDGLPDGRWEVANGKAVLMTPAKFWHQRLSDRVVAELSPQIEAPGRGFVTSAVAVLIPVPPGVRAEIQSRIPDIVISSREPVDEYPVGDPPEWVIEILSTRRGNVERTEKMDDYARAGVPEYWIMSPLDRRVEVYSLHGGEYVLVGSFTHPRSLTFPGVSVDMSALWPNL